MPQKTYDIVLSSIPVPETIIVPRSEIKGFQITREIRDQVGVPFVVKPAWGDSGVGVILDADSEHDLEDSAEQAPLSDAFLIQQRMRMQPLGGRMGWFRLYHICREVTPCWWDPVTHEYQLVSPTQIRQFRLQPLRRIMRNIASVSKMKKFSSEI